MVTKFHSWSARGLRGAAAAVLGAGLLMPANVSAGEGGFAQWQPRGPIFHTLDTIAGGIEAVLHRTVLPSHRRGAGPCCDSAGCDDACDQMTLRHLEMSPPLPPPQTVPTPGSGVQVMRPVPLPSHSSPPQAAPMQRVPPRAGPAPTTPVHRMPARKTSPRLVRPLPTVRPEHGTAPAVESGVPARPARPIPPQQEYDDLRNPFLDDPPRF